jgi:hypothetical protein
MTGDILEGNHELLMQLKDAPALKVFQKKASTGCFISARSNTMNRMNGS